MAKRHRIHSGGNEKGVLRGGGVLLLRNTNSRHTELKGVSEKKHPRGLQKTPRGALGGEIGQGSLTLNVIRRADVSRGR